MIFSLKQIQEKVIDENQEMFVVVVDFKKAFNTVDRVILWKVLELFGCSCSLIQIIKQLHDGT